MKKSPLFSTDLVIISSYGSFSSSPGRLPRLWHFRSRCRCCWHASRLWLWWLWHGGGYAARWIGVRVRRSIGILTTWVIASIISTVPALAWIISCWPAGQPVHHNQHIQLLRPEETSEAFYHQQKEENFSEEKQIWWSCLSKPYRTKTGIRAENHFSINHSSESDYRMPPITCRSLSFTCPVNELHRAHLLEAFGLLLADRLKTAWTEPCVHADHSFR